MRIAKTLSTRDRERIDLEESGALAEQLEAALVHGQVLLRDGVEGEAGSALRVGERQLLAAD